MFCVEPMTTILSVVSLCFSLFRLKILIQLSLKTWPLVREPFDFLLSVAQRRILFDISEVALRLLLIAVAFYTS